MNKDLHDIDDTFNEAHQRYEEEPADGVWDKINAALDKKDAEKYKRRFIGWKRVAVILIFLLSGFVLYESGVLKKYSGTTYKSVSGGSTSKDSEKNSIPVDISKRHDNNDINNQTKIPVIKEPVNEKNILNKESGQQNTAALIDDKNQTIIINTISPFEKKYIVTTDSINKSGRRQKQQVPVSQHTNKRVKEQNDERLVTEKKIRQHILPEDINSSLNNMAVNEHPLIKKYITTPADKIPSYKIISELMTFKENTYLNIPDSVLSKNLAFNQIRKGKIKFKPYWSFTGFVSNDRAQYKLENDVEDNNGQPRQDESLVIAKRERHEPSFSTGIIATRQFTKHIALKTGLIYSNTAIVINPQEIYATQKTDGTIAYKYNTSSGYGYIKPGFGLPPAVGDSLRSAEAQHSLQTLSVPLLLGYRIEKKRFAITPSAGITANIITRAKIQTEIKDALNRETVTINGLNGLNHFYAGFIADVNLQYNLDKRWAINVLPVFKYAVSPITKSNVVKTFPYSFGIAAGITYKF